MQKEKVLTMGSLFDGIGGFPLAAVHNGIVPVWASEIEAFPIEVTKKHFPNMIHVGDITKLNGAELPPVDIICGGSPCQDQGWPGRRPFRPVHGTGPYRKGDAKCKHLPRTDSCVCTAKILLLGERPRSVQLRFAQGGGLPDRPRGSLQDQRLSRSCPWTSPLVMAICWANHIGN